MQIQPILGYFWAILGLYQSPGPPFYISWIRLCPYVTYSGTVSYFENGSDSLCILCWSGWKHSQYVFQFWGKYMRVQEWKTWVKCCCVRREALWHQVHSQSWIKFRWGTIERFHVTSYQANFASRHTRDRHVGFLGTV